MFNGPEQGFGVLGRLRVGVKNGIVVVEPTGKLDEVHP